MLFNKLSAKTTALITAGLISLGSLGAITPAQAVVDCTAATADTASCTVLKVETFGDVIQPALVAEFR